MDLRRRTTVEHAVESALFLGAVALAGAAVLPGAGVPGWLLPLVWAVAGLAACLAVWAGTGRGALSLTCGSFGVTMALLTVWTELSGVWDYAVIGAWIIAMIVFTPLSVHAALTGVTPAPGERKAIEEKPDPRAEKLAEMAKFEHMFREIGCKEVEVTDLAEERSGRVVRLTLPRSGAVTIDTLEAARKQVEVILRLRPGCVEFETGSNSGDVFMRLREHDVFAEKVTLRPEMRASTVKEPFGIGVQEDGSVLKISLRELHLFIVGTTGAGKSNLINVILAQLAHCVDTVIWVIDMKGGRTAKPWLQAWSEGNAAAPAIDWVATTREEAAIMVRAFGAAVEARMNSGVGGSKISPSASTPQIILVCDEMADITSITRGSRKDVGDEGTSNLEFGKLIEQAVQKARSEACTSMWATQRGTNDMSGSGTLKSLCKLRIALGASTENDLRYVIPDARMAQKQMAILATVPGMGVAAVGRKSSQLSKFFWCDHVEGACGEGGNDGCVPSCPVYIESLAAGSIRPRLDKMTAAPLGDAYARRWQRAAEQPALSRMFRSPARAGAAVLDEDEVDISEFDAIVSRLGDDEASLNPVRKRVRAILGARGAQGASPVRLREFLQREGLMEGRDFARETLQRWLREDEQQGIVHQADFGRWVIGPRPKGKDQSAA